MIDVNRARGHQGLDLWRWRQSPTRWDHSEAYRTTGKVRGESFAAERGCALCVIHVHDLCLSLIAPPYKATYKKNVISTCAYLYPTYLPIRRPLRLSARRPDR